MAKVRTYKTTNLNTVKIGMSGEHNKETDEYVSTIDINDESQTYMFKGFEDALFGDTTVPGDITLYIDWQAKKGKILLDKGQHEFLLMYNMNVGIYDSLFIAEQIKNATTVPMLNKLKGKADAYAGEEDDAGLKNDCYRLVMDIYQNRLAELGGRND